MSLPGFQKIQLIWFLRILPIYSQTGGLLFTQDGKWLLTLPALTADGPPGLYWKRITSLRNNFMETNDGFCDCGPHSTCKAGDGPDVLCTGCNKKCRPSVS